MSRAPTSDCLRTKDGGIVGINADTGEITRDLTLDPTRDYRPLGRCGPTCQAAGGETVALPNSGPMGENSDEIDAVLNAGDKVEKALGEDKKAEAESERLQRVSDEQDARRVENQREQAQPAPPNSPPKGDNTAEMDAVLKEGDKVEKALDGGAKGKAAAEPAKTSAMSTPRDKMPDTLLKSAPGKKLSGCLPAAGIIAILGLVAVTYLVVLGHGGDDESGSPSGQSATTAASRSAQATPGASAQPSPSGSTSAKAEAAADGTAGGPPAVSSLPAGAILVKGRSGGEIGWISKDGQFRFLSLDAQGISRGDPSLMNTKWTQDGQVLEFGAKLSGPNKGRYGINIYINGDTYGPGVAIEKGQRFGVTKFDGTNGPLKAGQQLSILVGEAGNLEEKGENSLQWWFVFQPDPPKASPSS